MTRDVAERQAMEQLGSPRDLAVALGRARYERPRVLATVGGGAIKGGKGLFVGWFYGVLLLVPASAGLLLLFGLLDSLGFGCPNGMLGSSSGAGSRSSRSVQASRSGHGAASSRCRPSCGDRSHPSDTRGRSSAPRSWRGSSSSWSAATSSPAAVLLRAMLPLAVAVGAVRATRPLPRITLRGFVRGYVVIGPVRAGGVRGRSRASRRRVVASRARRPAAPGASRLVPGRLGRRWHASGLSGPPTPDRLSLQPARRYRSFAASRYLDRAATRDVASDE